MSKKAIETFIVEDLVEEEILQEDLEPEVEVEPELDEEVLPVETVELPETHTVCDGDTYAALGSIYAHGGRTGHEHAQFLYDLNGGKALSIGSVIRLG